MILVVGGTRGGGKVFADLMSERGHAVWATGRNLVLPPVTPNAIVFYQRDRENEFAAGVEATSAVVRHYFDLGMADASIVLIGSTSIHEADGTSSEYRMTKTAMRSLTRSYALEFKDKAIRVNMVSPGDFRHGPLTALDVAEVVAFFVSPQARFITGQEIVVRA